MKYESYFIVKLIASLSPCTTQFRHEFRSSTAQEGQLSISLIGTLHTLLDVSSILRHWILMYSSSDMLMDLDSSPAQSSVVWQSLDRASSSASIAILEPNAPLVESVFNGERLIFSFDPHGRRRTVFVSCSFQPRPPDYKQANFPQVTKVMSRLENSLQVLSSKRKRKDVEMTEIDCEDIEDYRPTKHSCTGLDGDLATWHPYSVLAVAMQF